MKPFAFHVIESLGRGGAETALVSGLPALKSLGWDVEVFALRPLLDLAPALNRHQIPVHVGVSSLVRRLRQTSKRRVVIHTHLFFANVWGRFLGASFGRPVVTTLHASDYRDNGPGRFGLRLALDKASLKVKRTTFLSVSEVVRLDYLDSLHVESSICPNPLDPFWLETPPSRQEARQRLGLGSEPVLFGCGRLHKHKGFDILARAANSLPGVRVVIAGGGADGNLIRSEGPVELIGSLDRGLVRTWLMACDVVAVPSRCESFGIFALEALSAGTAVVASDIEGLRDTLANAAVLVPPEDPNALADAVRTLMADPRKREVLGQAGKERSQNFTADNWARSHDTFYGRLLDGQSATPSSSVRSGRGKPLES